MQTPSSIPERPGNAALAINPVCWHYGSVKTTLDLPDELMRAVKIRAVKANRKLKDEVAYLLRRGLARGPKAPERARTRVQLPLVRCAHGAMPGEEMTPERVAKVLLDEEAEAVRAPSR